MRSKEKNQIRVAYLGPLASYTHQAAVNSCPAERCILEPQVDIRDVFSAVQSSHATFGVVPFENSSNGPVLYTSDLLIDRDNDFPNVIVFGETYVDVKHYLLGHFPNQSFPGGNPSGKAATTTTIKSMPNPQEPRYHPLNALRYITDVYSHPQAFGQSENFLSTHLKGAERHEVTSTSKAASLVGEDTSGTAAAISSNLAADVHGLSVLAEAIQDREDNTTRFFIIHNSANRVRPEEESDAITKWKVLVAFSINHKAQGALAEALLVYKKHALNLTSINSRPSRLRPWHYTFLVEFECNGQFLEVKPQIDSALQDLSKVTEGYKCIGYWQDNTVREGIGQ